VRRNATLFVLISLLAGFGSTAMSISAGLWLLDLTHSFALAALAGLCNYGPTFIGPWLGALVDRLPRRPLLVGVDVALCLLLLTLLTVHSARGAWLIYTVLLARGLSYGLLDAGETAILPAALPPSGRGTVNGWRSSAQEGTKLLAPLAGAGLYAWQGPLPVILLCAALPLATAACYALLRLDPPTPAPAAVAIPTMPVSSSPGTVSIRAVPDSAEAAGRSAAPPTGGGAWAGVALLFRLPAVRVPVLVAALAIAMSGLTNAAALAHLVHDLHLPAARLGLLSSAQGAGSIVGGLLVGRLLARRGPVRVAVLGAVLFGIGRLGWCLPWFPPAVVGSLLVGLGLP
jgi:MFS family permease